MTAILSVRNLAVTFPTDDGPLTAVRGVSFDLDPGKALGIVGESGCGKSVTALAIMGLLPSQAQITGSITLAGDELVGLSDAAAAHYRGRHVSMVFQDPMTALTPVLSIGHQLAEAIRAHHTVSRRAAWERAAELLDLVGIAEPGRRVRSFPHELSGGMRQRVMIAMAVANHPKVIIADEPTTALDVTIQAQILELLTTVARENSSALIMITHDVSVVRAMADESAVMYAGRIVETGPTTRLLDNPVMPYTQGLIAAVPRIDRKQPPTPIDGAPPSLIGLDKGCPYAPRCLISIDACRDAEPELLPLVGGLCACHRSADISADRITTPVVPPAPVYEAAPVPRSAAPALSVRNLERRYRRSRGGRLRRFDGYIYAVKNISFDLTPGETLAVVGESGCGKTSLLRTIMDMESGSTIMIDGTPVTPANRRELRASIQMVFQDPTSSLDPRFQAAQLIAEPLLGMSTNDKRERVSELAELVGLTDAELGRFPHEFSGGQRQRIAIARALATQPRVVVLDEPVASLDVSVQAGIMRLLADIQARIAVSYLVVTHDLGVVRQLAHRVAVMRAGEFLELDETQRLFTEPQHPYTKQLLRSALLA